jgi:hypothetical protein
MAADTLLKTQQDEVDCLVIVKVANANREIELQFEFGEGPDVRIWLSGLDWDEMSEAQKQRLENLTTNYVDNLAKILFNVN